MKKTTKKMTIVSLALCASAFTCVGLNMHRVAAQSAVELNDFKVASVALRVPDAQYGEGLRFKITMPATEYTEKNVKDFTTGVLLIPTAVLGNDELDISLEKEELVHETGLTWTVDEDNADNMATYVHVYDIDKAYYASAISLRAYIDDADAASTPAYTATTSCSVAYSADWAYNNDNTLDEGEKAALQASYLTYGVVYHNGDDETQTTGVYNQKLTAPQDPEKTGYTFAGWWNKAGTVEWNFDTNVIGGVTTNLYAKFDVNTAYLVEKIDELPEMTVRTTEIDGKIAEIDALLADVTDTSAVSNYADYVAYKEAYSLMGYLVLDMSNDTERATFDTNRFKGGDSFTSTMSATLATEQDATYGKVLSLADIAVSGTYSRVNFRNGDQDGAKWKERIKGYDYIVFYVYSSASCNLRYDRGDWSAMNDIDGSQFTADQAKKTAITGGQWNKIVLTYGQFYSMVHYNDADFGGVYFYFTTNLTGGSLKFSNFYGYSAEGFALVEQTIVNETIAKINALPETEIQTVAITAQIQEINKLYTQLSADGKAKVTNYATFTAYVTAYDKMPILKADLATLQSKQYGGSTFAAADASITAPEGVNGEVIKATQGWADSIASMIAIYDTENLRTNYSAWTNGKALLDNTGSKYSDHYVSFWVKGGEEAVTLSITTYSSDWSTYNEQRVTIEAGSAWQRVVLPIIADGKDKTNDMTYGWLAVMKLVDPTQNLGWKDHLTGKKNGSFYMCNFEIYANNPNA